MNSASGRAASRRKHLFLYVLVIAVGALGTVYVSRGEAHAATATAYSAEVEGDGLAINVVAARLPLVGPSISVSPWAAGSQLSTIGESVAFAGAPYLGPAVTPLYGTAQGLATNIGSNAASEVLGIIQGVIPLPLPPVNLPTLPIAGFKLPALPALPGYVRSSFPVARSNHVAAGAYNLSASSAARSNKADLLAGGNAGRAAGVAKVFASSTL